MQQRKKEIKTMEKNMEGKDRKKSKNVKKNENEKESTEKA